MSAAMELTPPSAGAALDGNDLRRVSSVDGDGDEIRRISFGPQSGGFGQGRRGVRKVDSFLEASNRVTPTGEVHARGTSDLPLKATLRLAFQALGVVFGDLGTSPLYVYDSTFASRNNPTKDEVLGALSLIFYTILLVPLIKYTLIVLQANDRGNGGTFAIYSLICRIAGIKVSTNQAPEDRALSSHALLPQNPKNLDRAERIKETLRESKAMRLLLLKGALFGTCAVIGDGVLTPAVSVLSAMSGIRTNFPNSVSQDVVTYTSAGILFLLFCFQRFGTDKIGFTFSPIVFLWFSFIFGIGCYNIHYYPAVFKAINPYYIYNYFKIDKRQAWISLGGIVLAITGTEAMFADVGHFSVTALQISFSCVVYPSIMIAYFGQAAYLIHKPEVIGATFYKSIPHPIFWPVFVVATAAAIIASQAMITATYSIVEQSMVLGCFPNCKLMHTSKKFAGQIYIPEINWVLMVLTIAVTIGFKTGTQLGNAYGWFFLLLFILVYQLGRVAVVSVMLVTTDSLTLVILMVWQKSIWMAVSFFVVFFCVEGVYYSSVLYKIPQGGWLSLAFVAVFFTIMFTWTYGKRASYKYEEENKISLDWVLGLGSSLGMVRVPGVGLVYSELARGVPSIFAHLTTNLPAVHAILVFVCVKHLPVPYVQEDERLLVRRVGPRQYHMYRIAARYGYAELKDGDIDFERQIMDCLASFIRTEGHELQQKRQLGAESYGVQQQEEHRITGSRGVHHESAVMMDALEQAHRSSIDCSFELVPKLLSESLNTNLDQEVEEELALLEQSRQAGIVYLLGHTEVKATENSNLLRKFMIDYAYSFLRKNTRGSTLGLGIPPTKVVQIGMLHYV